LINSHGHGSLLPGVDAVEPPEGTETVEPTEDEAALLLLLL
jgi:hypothetical protein